VKALLSRAVKALLSTPVSLGVVQTAYANGASSAYVARALGAPPLLAKACVKFVHAAAAAFDIANGHGTVLFHAELAAKLACDGSHKAFNAAHGTKLAPWPFKMSWRWRPRHTFARAGRGKEYMCVTHFRSAFLAPPAERALHAVERPRRATAP
jgi:hypothetical protein